MNKTKLRLRPLMRPIIRWLKYFEYNTYFIDGDRSRVSIGKRCGLANTLFNTTSGLITIGDQCIFGYNVMLLTGRHNFSGGVRASLLSKTTDGSWGGGEDEVPAQGRDITIGTGCWVASGVTISGGVSIGANCVISAGSIVTRSIPPDSIVAGVPARVIGSTRSIVD